MPSQQNKLTPPKTSRRFKALILLLFWVAAFSAIVIHKQSILDWWALRNYDPPTAIAQLASQSSMNDEGRKIFYVNHPELVSRASFADYCPTDRGEQSIVLGCYHTRQADIYLLDVTDPRLDGVEQVTSAHEMLHSAYDRLSTSERERVNKMLRDYYENDLKDERILGTIEAYKLSEPDDLVNEMHSIFATEIATLPTQLESYYVRYFTNRAAVAGFAAKYQGEFTSREAQADQYVAQMNSLKAQIESLRSNLDSREQALEASKNRLNTLRSSGDTDAYNASVPGHNAQIAAYNAEIGRVNSLINQYNQLRAKLIAISVEEKQLINELQPLNN